MYVLTSFTTFVFFFSGDSFATFFEALLREELESLLLALPIVSIVLVLFRGWMYCLSSVQLMNEKGLRYIVWVRSRGGAAKCMNLKVEDKIRRRFFDTSAPRCRRYLHFLFCAKVVGSISASLCFHRKRSVWCRTLGLRYTLTFYQFGHLLLLFCTGIHM